MGFGILFFGYCITYVIALNNYGVYIRLFGYLIMFLGCKKLSEYEKRFAFAQLTSALLVVVSAFESVYSLLDFLSMNLIIDSMPIKESLNTVVSYVGYALVLIFHIFLLLAIRKIAKDTDIVKIEAAAIRNLCFVILYFILSVISYIPSPIRQDYIQSFSGPIFILNLVWIVLNIITLFSCYKNICDENDTEMEQKPSRFEFVNRYRAELDARRQAADEKWAKKEAEKRKRKKK